MLYVASNAELPLLPWNESDPGFHVTELSEQEKSVKPKFKNRHVYYAGAYEGCGCGFQAGEYPGYEDNEIDLKIASLSGLADYLDAQLEKGVNIELFGCWDGDQTLPIENERTVSPESFRSKVFWFKDREYLVVKPTA
jgi:hypothetical protein